MRLHAELWQMRKMRWAAVAEYERGLPAKVCDGAAGPMRTLVSSAENDRFEPILPYAALSTNVRFVLANHAVLAPNIQ